MAHEGSSCAHFTNMNNTTEIKNFGTLEKVLQSGVDGSIKIEQSQLMTLVSVFYALHQELSSKFEKESENDVLYSRHIGDNVDFLVVESFSRAKCVELFLLFQDLPLELYGKFKEQLPKFKEMAILNRNIIENKKSMLQTLKDAGITKPQSSNSGCMIVLLVILSLWGGISFLS